MDIFLILPQQENHREGFYKGYQCFTGRRLTESDVSELNKETACYNASQKTETDKNRLHRLFNNIATIGV